MNINLNEKFLLKILEYTEYVHNDHDLGEFTFESNGLDVEIRIPYSHSSEQVNIHFIYSFENENGNLFKETINFSFDSPNEIKNFMNELYKNYELTLNPNYDTISNQILEKFENMLKYPCNIQGVEDNLPFIEDRNTKDCYYIDIHEAVFNFDERKTFTPLAPLIIPCHYRSIENGGVERKYKKVIPAYLVHEYISLTQFTKVDSVVKNINEFNDMLDKLHLSNSPSGKILNAVLLDNELINNNKIQKPKNKL